VIFTLSSSGLLNDFADWVVRAGLDNTTAVLAFLVWISVGLSAIMDNVPYTILMIPVCQSLAASIGVEAWSFLYGMLIGTGIGGNITPVGATANVFACGILERHGIRVPIGRYLKLSLPFSLAAVATAHLLIQWIWL
jgi:Na+/H+ antiporter NhaD/arsenite permease-like protein